MAPLYDRLQDPLIALSLLTRIPVRLKPDAYTRSADAAWAYPLVGTIPAGTIALVGLACLSLGLPPLVAAMLGLGASFIVTGAMHEDGLADCADGFWGGWDPEMRLKIMKDSQIGTYGVLTLIATVLIRVLAIAAILPISGGAWLLASVHIGSRAIMPVLMTSLPHARSDGLSRSVGRVGKRTAVVSAMIGATCLLLTAQLGLNAVFIVALVTGLWAWLALRKIKGQTGDVLGAGQQITEVALLLTVLATI